MTQEADIPLSPYLFRYGESVSTVLGKLTRGEVEYARIAVPEGLMLTEIASLLQEKAEVDSAEFHQAATDIDKPPVLHTGRAGRLATAAGKAAIQVDLRLSARCFSFQCLLDQVYTSARAIQFIAK